MNGKWMAIWPGLPQLWYQGNWQGLVFALCFAWTAILTLTATFYWPLWISGWIVRMLWCSLAMGCGVALFRSIPAWPQIVGHAKLPESVDHWFTEAQQLYLQGDYFGAESKLHLIFAKGHQDLEAAILMISILRRTKRWKQAIYGLERLGLLEQSSRWARELAMERQAIERVMSEAPMKQNSDTIDGETENPND